MNVWCAVFVTGQPQYPVERVLLTSGILTAAINCRYAALRNAGVPNPDIKTPQEVVRSRADTPWLRVAYRAYDTQLWRPLGSQPVGALMSASEARTPPPSLSAHL